MARLALNCIGSAVLGEDVTEFGIIQRRLLPHAHKCLECIHGSINFKSQDNQNILDAIHNLGILYADQVKLAKAEAMYQRALAGYEKAWGPEHT